MLLTVNPQLLEGRRFTTLRTMINALSKHADLLIAPVDSYDFEQLTVHAYRRVQGGKFASVGRIAPEADLWIVYSDGYYLDSNKFGFRLRRDYFKAQVDFHKSIMLAGKVGALINSPDAEMKTLKNWLVQLDPDTSPVMPTYSFTSIHGVHAFLKEQGQIVAKPNWGGGGEGVLKISDQQSLKKFERDLASCRDRELPDYSFQPYSPGPEKRFWFAGGQFAGARIIWDRDEPWEKRRNRMRVQSYDATFADEFAADLAAAQQLQALSGLSIGAVDFIGRRINDINGCGTLFTQYVNWNLIVDARPVLAKHLVGLVSAANSEP